MDRRRRRRHKVSRPHSPPSLPFHNNSLKASKPRNYAVESCINSFGALNFKSNEPRVFCLFETCIAGYREAAELSLGVSIL